LCTGFAWCEHCEHKLVSRPTNRVPTMVCSSLDWHGGCGGVAINAAKLEAFVSGWVLGRLSDRRFLEGLAAAGRPDTAELVAAIEADERRLIVLGGGLTVGDPEAIPEQLAAIRTVRAHIAARRQDIARAATGGLLEQVDPEMIAEQWWGWREHNLPLCRSLLGLLVERIWVRSIGRGVRTVDARRVSIVPRP